MHLIHLMKYRATDSENVSEYRFAEGWGRAGGRSLD
jgi:hypothetical protein